jgi:hypothetical protein
LPESPKLPNIAEIETTAAQEIANLDFLAILAFLAISSHPIPKSAADSSGVPHTRQITAEQSPQVSGSVTSRAQLGQ